MIIIADAGNTKTDWVLTGTGIEQQRTRTAGISPYFDTELQIEKTIAEVKCAFAHITPTAIYYYGTGCTDASKQEVIRRSCRVIYPSTDTVEVLDDLTGAGIALFGDEKGIAVITGTGSNAGITHHGTITRRIISLGYLLGDEGSGAAIGLAFLKQLLSLKLSVDLTETFYQWKETTPEALITELYGARKPQSIAASLVPFIHKYRHERDMAQIITTAFHGLLKEMVLPMRGEDPNIVAGFCGSIAHAFKDELTLVCAQYGVEIGAILREPAREIAAYHTMKL